MPFFKNKVRGFIVYYVGLLGIFLTTMLLRVLYLKTGIATVASNVAFHHNHIFVLLAALGLFFAFSKIEIKPGKLSALICKVSSCTLGVYLIHCHTFVENEWTGWYFHWLGKPTTISGFLGELIIAVLTMFAIGVLVEFIRQRLFSLIGKAVSHIIK